MGTCAVPGAILTGAKRARISCADVQEGATRGSDKSHAIRRVRPDVKTSGPGLGGTPNERIGMSKRISRCIACIRYRNIPISCLTEHQGGLMMELLGYESANIYQIGVAVASNSGSKAVGISFT